MHITVVAISEEEKVFTMHIFLIITSLLITWISIWFRAASLFACLSEILLLYSSSEMALCFSLSCTILRRLSIGGSRAVASFLYLNLNFSCWYVGLEHFYICTRLFLQTSRILSERMAKSQKYQFKIKAVELNHLLESIRFVHVIFDIRNFKMRIMSCLQLSVHLRYS